MDALVTDVVLRDGLQDESVFVAIPARVGIVSALADAGVRSLEVASFVNPERVPQMAAAEELIGALPELPGVAYRAIALNDRGVTRAIGTNIASLALVVSASEEHSIANVRRSRDQVLADYSRVAAGVEEPELVGSVATAFTDPSGNPTPERELLEVLDALQRMGIRKVGLADTTGVAATSHVAKLLEAARREMPSLELFLHLHDAHGQALDSVDAALELGITEFDAALGGLGGCPFVPGAAGNLDTEALVAHLHARGVATGIDLGRLAAARELLRTVLRAAPALAPS